MEKSHIALKIPSDVFYVDLVRTFVGKLAERLEFSRKRGADIQLVLDEICTNAVKHGSSGVTDSIGLCIGVDKNTLEILVQDTGRADAPAGGWITPERLREIEANRSPWRESGHGIFIAKSIADVHEMQCNAAGGTDVRVVFHRERDD